MVRSALRRDMMLAALAASLPLGLAENAAASPLNPEQPITVRRPSALETEPGLPRTQCRQLHSDRWPDPVRALLHIDTLVARFHERATPLHERSVLRRGVGHLVVQQRADFDPAACVPVHAGSFVRRVAGTPHYDGVIRGQPEPAIIAICGVGPLNFGLGDPSQPRASGGMRRRLAPRRPGALDWPASD